MDPTSAVKWCLDQQRSNAIGSTQNPKNGMSDLESSNEENTDAPFSEHSDADIRSRSVSGRFKLFVRESFIQTLENMLKRALLSRNLRTNDTESSMGDSLETVNSQESETRKSEKYSQMHNTEDFNRRLTGEPTSGTIQDGSSGEYNQRKKICCVIS